MDYAIQVLQDHRRAIRDELSFEEGAKIENELTDAIAALQNE